MSASVNGTPIDADDEVTARIISSIKNYSPFSTIGIVGLGLIGGSLAKAVNAKTTSRVLGYDADETITEQALRDGVIDGRLAVNDCDMPGNGVHDNDVHNNDVHDNDAHDNDAHDCGINDCDLIITALYPDDVINWCSENFKHMKPGTVVVDCAGVKTQVCEVLVPLAKSYKLRFVGGHPMAGIERSGYANSFAELFDGATMILCEDNRLLGEFFMLLGFGRIKVTTAREHDEIIAYTSQLAHLLSSAYIHGQTMHRRYGFSAGSFKDLTRVARLNPQMWTKLFFENKDCLLKETDEFIESVIKYRDALANSDVDAMTELLRTGTELKIQDEEEEQKWLKGLELRPDSTIMES
jgi:prephenate dehydrogenase